MREPFQHQGIPLPCVVDGGDIFNSGNTSSGPSPLRGRGRVRGDCLSVHREPFGLRRPSNSLTKQGNGAIGILIHSKKLAPVDSFSDL